MLATLVERDKLANPNYLGSWLTLGLVTLLCPWTAARLFWQLMPGEPSANNSQYSTPGGIPNPSTGNTPVTDLSSLTLVGRGAPGLAPSISFDAPETQLDLKLQGTLAGDDPKSGLAIIADDRGNEASYAVGDALPGGAALHEIYPERVILSRQGQYESLRLREPDKNHPSQRFGTSTRPNTTPAGGRQPQFAGIKGVNWAELQQQQRLDPVALAKQIQVLPFTQNGQQIGVRLQAGRDAALLGRLGLRSSDVITSVNGIALNDPSKAFELLRQLNTATQFNVVLLRNGSETTLNINLNQ